MVLPTYENECFFIAPIGDEGSDVRKRSDGVLNFIVKKAAAELGLTAIRADDIAKPGQITLQVVEHVVNAKAVVADLTGNNPNVFYELAVRHAVRMPVVLICEKGMERLPFDIGQMRTIFFDHNDLGEADKCREDISTQLREAIEGGAVDSPIATAVDVTALQSGSTLEKTVAELVTMVSALAANQNDQFTATQATFGSLMELMLRQGPRRRLRDFPLKALDNLEVAADRLSKFVQSNAREPRVQEDMEELLRSIEVIRSSPAAEAARRTMVQARILDARMSDLDQNTLARGADFLEHLAKSRMLAEKITDESDE